MSMPSGIGIIDLMPGIPARLAREPHLRRLVPGPFPGPRLAQASVQERAASFREVACEQRASIDQSLTRQEERR